LEEKQAFSALQDFMGLTPDVGATLVVALDWAGTRPAPTFSDTPRDPKDPHFLREFSVFLRAKFTKDSLVQMNHACQ
jgi:hypothetical protein